MLADNLRKALNNSGDRIYGLALAGTSPTVTSEIDGIRFSDETLINPSAALSVVRAVVAGLSSTTKGFAAGGANSVTASTAIDGVQFATLAAFTSSAILSTPRGTTSGVSNLTKGIVGGGAGNNSTPLMNSMERLDFATEVSGVLAANLPTPRQIGGAAVCSGAKGYFMGGRDSGMNANFSVIDGVNMSTEAAIGLSSTLSATRSYAVGVSSLAFGYALGGFGTAVLAIIQRIVFSTEVVSVLSATLPSSRQAGAGVSSLGKGFSMGGHSGTTYISSIASLQFSNETTGTSGASLSVARQQSAGVHG